MPTNQSPQPPFDARMHFYWSVVVRRSSIRPNRTKQTWINCKICTANSPTRDFHGSGGISFVFWHTPTIYQMTKQLHQLKRYHLKIIRRMYAPQTRSEPDFGRSLWPHPWVITTSTTYQRTLWNPKRYSRLVNDLSALAGFFVHSEAMALQLGSSHVGVPVVVELWLVRKCQTDVIMWCNQTDLYISTVNWR